jgi:hypothetical protein
VLRVEAEQGRLTRPFALRFDGDLSGLYSVRVGGREGGRLRDRNGRPGPWPVPPPMAGGLELVVDVPVTADYRVWAYTRGDPDGHLTLQAPDGTRARVDAASNGWRWQRAQREGRLVELLLAAGRQSIVLRGQSVGSEIDQVVLTDDPDWRPEGPARLLPMQGRAGPVGALQSVRARALSPYACRLDWAPPAPGVSPPLVHLARANAGDAGMAARIASVRTAHFVDSGLRPGEHARYVLRRDAGDTAYGAAVEVECTTPRLAPRVQQVLDVTHLKRSWQLHFDLDRAGEHVVWILLAARAQDPSGRGIEVCLDRGGSTCRAKRADYEGRWMPDLGPITQSTCCPPPMVVGEAIWLRVPLSEAAPASVGDLTIGPHRLTLWPDDRAAFEICTALLTNDLGFVPGDDPRLPRAPWSYTSAPGAALGCPAGADSEASPIARD